MFGDTPVPFKYGEPQETQHSARTSNIVCLIIMPLMLVGGLYLLWSKRVNNWMVGNESR
jgi:hypothetical protein